MSYRTSRIVIRSGGKHKAFYHTTLQNMRHAKAVYNTTLFHIRNLFTGLRKDEDKRTENERKVITNVTEAIADVNQMRARKGAAPYDLPTPESPYLSAYLWLSVMNRILKRDCPRPDTFYSKLEQTTISSACLAMKSFTQSLKDYAKHPGKYTGRPQMPRYIKADTFTLNYDCQMVTCHGDGKKHTLELKAVAPRLKTGKKRFANIVSVRLAYRHGEIVASVCTKDRPRAGELPGTGEMYSLQNSNPEGPNEAVAIKEALQHTDQYRAFLNNRSRVLHFYFDFFRPDPDRMLGIDPGVQNFLTICPGFGAAPFIIRGGRLKAVNQYYNKEKSRLQSQLKKEQDRHNSHRIDRLETSRENFLFNYFHQTACLVVNYALRERAGTIVIGHSIGWKQKVEMKKKTNQKFVYIPFLRFFRILEDKARRSGIRVVYTEESYTSQASALDRDLIPVYRKGQYVPNDAFQGKRVKRGLYQSKNGRLLNADVNGAANIIRKYKETGLQEDLSYLTGPVYTMNVA